MRSGSGARAPIHPSPSLRAPTARTRCRRLRRSSALAPLVRFDLIVDELTAYAAEAHTRHVYLISMRSRPVNAYACRARTHSICWPQAAIGLGLMLGSIATRRGLEPPGRRDLPRARLFAHSTRPGVWDLAISLRLRRHKLHMHSCHTLNLAEELKDHDEEVFLTEVWNDNDYFLYTALTARCENLLTYGEVQDRGSVEELRIKAQLPLVPRDDVYATT